MLMPTNDKIQKIMFLRDVVIPFVKEREKEGKVNLDEPYHECGSPSCLYGWSTAFVETGIKRGNFLDSKQILGITAREHWLLFGTSSSGSLDDRAAACDRIIERMVAEVTP